MNALVYGHSQAQPTGMGDDMVAALKKRKIKVTRLGLQGRSDKALIKESGKLGDVSGFDLVFLYCGGNNSTREDTLKLVEHFGPKRVVAILPPINLDRDVGTPNEQRIANQQSYQATVQTLAPTYRLEGGRAADFKKDQIHLRSGTAAGKALVEKILTDLGVGAVSGGSAPAGSPASASPAGLPTPGLALVAVGAAALLLALWFRSRR